MGPPSPTPISPLRLRPPDHRDLVTALTVPYLGHERADEQQPPAAGVLHVGRVERVRQLRRVEARPLVADDVHRLLRRLPGRDVHPPAAVRLLEPPLVAQPVVLRA